VQYFPEHPTHSTSIKLAGYLAAGVIFLGIVLIGVGAVFEMELVRTSGIAAVCIGVVAFVVASMYVSRAKCPRCKSWMHQHVNRGEKEYSGVLTCSKCGLKMGTRERSVIHSDMG